MGNQYKFVWGEAAYYKASHNEKRKIIAGKQQATAFLNKLHKKKFGADYITVYKKNKSGSWDVLG